MMKTNPARNLVRLLTILAFSTLIRGQVAAAPKLTFDPANITIGQNQTTTVSLNIDAETNQTIGADAMISYPNTDVEIVSVADGGFYEDFSYSDSASSGKLEIHGLSFNSFKTGSGLLATITIRAKKGSGGNIVTFSCTGADDSSKITKDNGQNILNCSAVNQLALSFTGAADDTPTPTLSPSPTPTGTTSQPSPTPTRAGSPTQYAVCNFLAVDKNYGPAPLTVSMICAGNDPDDDLWAAEFSFGDGNKKEIVKNVGNSGSYTLTYVYGTPGTFTPTCRVRDINYLYSPASNDCKRTVTVTGTGINPTTTSGVKPTPAPTKKSSTPLSGPVKSTPQAVKLVDFIQLTPTIPIPEVQKETKKFDLPRLFLGISIITISLLVGGYLMYKNRNTSPPPSIPITKE